MSGIVIREFRSPRSKLARAKHHIASLTTALDEYKNQVHVESKIELLTPDHGAIYKRWKDIPHIDTSIISGMIRQLHNTLEPPYAHCLHINAAPLEDLNAIAADVVQNLRQALDHAACASARSLGRTDGSVYFPVRSGTTNADEVEREAKRFKDQTRKLHDDVRAIIEKADPGGGLIYELHKLGLADKHRLICECKPYASAHLRHMRAGTGWIVSGFDGDEWDSTSNRLTFALTSSPQELDYSFSFSIEVRLKAGGAIGAKPIITAFGNLVKVVDRTIEKIYNKTCQIHKSGGC
ncbi:hypothetical protein [Methylobacterium radiodurans]|uniref:hypothetical protein n=1 Tax=Methylobacterium radiodurans TaxID=2202828 RepID=UPI0013A53419|nr:hypothetical protein [Methylobacterium radiodurans]